MRGYQQVSELGALPAINRGRSEGSQTAGWWLLTVLSLAQVVSFLDRTILSLLIVPIKADLGLSDTQLGLLQGLGFSMLYCLLSIPVGRLVDSVDRRRLISTGVVLWSGMTALSGFARSFTTLFAARLGVGLGETVLIPAAASLLSDAYPPRKLGRAMAVFGMGAYLGNGLAFIGGGALLAWLAHIAGDATYPPWRIAFFLAAIPGLIIVVLLATIKEPKRLNTTSAGRGHFGEALAQIKAHRFAYAAHFVVSCSVSMLANATNAWVPAALIRTHGISISNAGLIFGTVVLFAGSLGIFTGGSIADRLWGRGRRDGYQLLFAVACVAALVPGVLYPLESSLPVAIALLVVFYFLAIMPISATIAALQLMTPSHMRGLVTALFLAGSTTVGLGLGPAFVAVMSDYFYGGGPQGLSWALATMVAIACTTGAIAAWVNRTAFMRAVAASETKPDRI
jgi:MFS family permease